MKVLIVDDEADVAEVITLTFKMQWPACEVISASDGETALELVADERPDVVLLDVGLPGLSGFEVCERLRQVSDVPILMLTVMGEEMHRVRGLEMGADDYIAKPFSPLELVARTRAVLRRAQMLPMSAPAHIVVDGDLSIELGERQVVVKGQPVKLTPTEFRLLSHLVSNAGNVLPHEALLAKAWGHQSQDDVSMLKVHIARLREKLGDDAHDPRYIFTEWGIGYRFARPRAAV
ncbi:MAG: response regulator transcription factor [Dehalococcoidia bacterium]